MEKTPMTVNGEKILRLELERLKTEERPRIVQAISEAREQGELRENAEYQYAKEEQGFIEGRILDIESKLANANVIDVNQITPTGKVIFGSTVKLLNCESDEEVQYKIVGDEESDIKLSKISVYSPIARALIGKNEGETAIVSTPKGPVEYEICKVEHL